MVSDGNKTRISSTQETLLLAQSPVLIRQCIGGWRRLVLFPSMCCKGELSFSLLLV
jgi:hypothetical protein